MRRLPALSAIAFALLAAGSVSCVLEEAEGVNTHRRTIDSGSPGGGSVTAGTTTGASVGSSTNATSGSSSASGTGSTAGTGGAGGSGSGPGSGSGSAGTTGSGTGSGGAGGAGGGGTLDAGPTSDGSVGVPDAGSAPKLSTHVVPILKAACAVSGCHDAIKKEHGMDFSTAMTTYAGVVNKTSTDHCRNNMAVTRVIPGQPQNSYLIVVIEGINRCAEVPQMPPPPRQPLTMAQIQTVRDWITAGAKND